VSEHVVVLCTVPDDEVAGELARALVKRRLAACVNVIGGVRSTYRWQNKIESSEERLLVIKTRADRFDALRDAVVELHPCEVPELLAMPVTAGNPAYLNWLDESV
jgi:periplasmic divalent cation tolerance protein